MSSSKETKVEVTPATPSKKVANPLVNPNKGFPVEPGKNWVTGMTHDQRVRHQIQHEHTWKKKYNAAGGTVSGQQNFSRG